jgi:hypothetical protein
MVAHRRAGKTVACINELIERAIRNKRQDPRYAYIGPLLSQAKDIAWSYLKQYTEGLTSKVSESELYVVLRHNGARIRIYGADNPDRIRGLYFDGAVVDEFGDMAPFIWSDILIPALSDRDGWVVFIGTPKGKNHFYSILRRAQGEDMLPGDTEEYIRRQWYWYVLRASESGVFSPEKLRELKREQGEETYAQEYECDFNAIVRGTYYAAIIRDLEATGQIYSSDADIDKSLPVKVAFDLGRTDSTAAWFWQRRPDGIAWGDYVEAAGEHVDFYIDMLNSKGYQYEKIWLPHDARAKTLQTKRSTVEQMRDAGFPIDIVPKLDIMDRINASRRVLRTSWFSPKTKSGVECLRAYKRQWDDRKQTFVDDPLHDWASHGSDAFGYAALVVEEPLIGASRRDRVGDVQSGAIAIPSLSEIFTLERLHEDRMRRSYFRRRI